LRKVLSTKQLFFKMSFPFFLIFYCSFDTLGEEIEMLQCVYTKMTLAETKDQRSGDSHLKTMWMINYKYSLVN
jgi:hypothetical protein